LFVRNFKHLFLVAACFLWLAGPVLLSAQGTPIPPSPTRWVTDTANFLSVGTLNELNAKLEAYERSTGHQVIVYIGKTTGGIPIEEWAVRAFEAWKVGRKGIDDGLVLFIMAEDREVRIEVGYGLEPVVPDARAFRVIDEIIIPRLRSGDNDGAVSEAISSLLQTISGTSQDEGSKPAGRSGLKVSNIFIAIAVIFFLILFITNPSLALWLLVNILSSGKGGGGGGRSWGGGRGGFSGGGGRSGGGGASGSW
jgi:uncharacterized protein